MWTSKTKGPGQVESARSSATVPCDNRDAEFNFDPQIIAVSACPNVIPTALRQRFKAAFFLLRAKSAVSSLSDRSYLVH